MPRYLGGDDYLVTAANAVSGLDVDVKTWSYWIYVDSEPGSITWLAGTAIADTATSDKRAALAIRPPSSAGWRAHYTENGTTADGEWHGTDNSIDAWHHVMITHDRSSASNEPVIYVDGVSQTITVENAMGGTAEGGDDTVKIGFNPGVSGTLWIEDSFIAHLAIWGGVALSATEAQSLYRGVHPTRIRTANLEWYSPLGGEGPYQSGVTVTHGVTLNNTSNTSSYTTGSFTPSAGDLLICYSSAVGTAAATAISDSDSGNWIQIVNTAWSGAAIDVFARLDKCDGSSMTITTDYTGDNARGCNIVVLRVAGVSRFGDAAIVQSSTNSNTSGVTPSATFSSNANTNNLTMAILTNISNPAGVTPPTNWTEQDDSGHNNPSHGVEYATRLSGFASTTITWGGSSSSDWHTTILEIDTRQGEAELRQGIELSIHGATRSATAAPYVAPIFAFGYEMLRPGPGGAAAPAVALPPSILAMTGVG